MTSKSILLLTITLLIKLTAYAQQSPDTVKVNRLILLQVIKAAQDGLSCDSLQRVDALTIASDTQTMAALDSEIKAKDSVISKYYHEAEILDSLYRGKQKEMEVRVKQAKVKWYWWPVVGVFGWLIGKEL